MHFRILRMNATSGFLTALECNNSFSAGALPRAPLGEPELTALPRPAGLRSPNTKRRRGERKGARNEKGIEKGRGGKKRKGE